MSKKVVISVVLLAIIAVIAAIIFLDVPGENLTGRLVKKLLPAYNESVVRPCSNGIDDDNDGYTDYPADKKCMNSKDTELKEIPGGCQASQGNITLMWALAFQDLPSQQFYSSEEVFNYLKNAKNGPDKECYIKIEQKTPIGSTEEVQGNKFVFVTNMDRIDVSDESLAINQIKNFIEDENGVINSFGIDHDNYGYAVYEQGLGGAYYNNFWIDNLENSTMSRSFSIRTPVYSIYRIASGGADWDSLETELEQTLFEGNTSFEVSFNGTDLASESCPNYFQQIYPNANLSWENIVNYVSSIGNDESNCQLALVGINPYKGLVPSFDIRIKIKDLNIDNVTKKISYQFSDTDSFTIDLSKAAPEFTAEASSQNENGEGGVIKLKSRVFYIYKTASMAY